MVETGVFIAPRRSGTGFLSARPVAMAYMKICPLICITRRAISSVPLPPGEACQELPAVKYRQLAFGPASERVCCSRRATSPHGWIQTASMIPLIEPFGGDDLKRICRLQRCLAFGLFL